MNSDKRPDIDKGSMGSAYGSPIWMSNYAGCGSLSVSNGVLQEMARQMVHWCLGHDQHQAFLDQACVIRSVFCTEP